MDQSQERIGAAKSFYKLFIRPIVDVYKAEVVVLSIGPSSLWIVIELEPVNPDNIGLSCECHRRCGCPLSTLILFLYRHQMAIISISGAIFVCSEKPLGDNNRFVGCQFPKPVEVVPCNPPIRAVDVV